jgi:hypothetical protein
MARFDRESFPSYSTISIGPPRKRLAAVEDQSEIASKGAAPFHSAPCAVCASVNSSASHAFAIVGAPFNTSCPGFNMKASEVRLGRTSFHQLAFQVPDQERPMSFQVTAPSSTLSPT